MDHVKAVHIAKSAFLKAEILIYLNYLLNLSYRENTLVALKFASSYYNADNLTHWVCLLEQEVL